MTKQDAEEIILGVVNGARAQQDGLRPLEIINHHDVRALRDEAVAAGDNAMAAMCDAWLEGDPDDER